jgi:hypothetical protein
MRRRVRSRIEGEVGAHASGLPKTKPGVSERKTRSPEALEDGPPPSRAPGPT